MSDLVFQALNELLAGRVRRGQVRLAGRTLRWVEAGTGAPTVILDAGLGEPGSLAFTGVLPAVAELTRVIAYDRAGIGASDPISPITVRSQIEDLAAVVAAAGTGPCVLAGHSWGGLLVLMTAAQHPELVAGLVLIDPADETYWSKLPREIHQESTDTGTRVIKQHAAGELAAAVRDTYVPIVARLTDNQRHRDLLVEAYVSCWSHEWQACTIMDESLLFNNSTAIIHQIRSSAPLPNVPLVVLSATIGAAPEHRAMWTAVHADLARSVSAGTHTVLADTHHAINADRPEAVVAALSSVIANVRAGWEPSERVSPPAGRPVASPIC